MSRQQRQQQQQQESEDEALARALQMQFEREEAQAQQQPQAAAAVPTTTRTAISDEEIARRVQAQEEERYRQRLAAASQQQQPPQATVAAAVPQPSSLANYSSSNPRTATSTPQRSSKKSSSKANGNNSPSGVLAYTGGTAAAAAAANNTERSDAELARRLAAEEEAAQAAAAVEAANRRSSSAAAATTNSGGFVFPAPENPERSRSNNKNRPTQAASGGYVFPGATTVASAEDEPPSAVFSDAAANNYSSNNNNGTLADTDNVVMEDSDADYARRVEQELQDELVAERLQQREQYKANRAAATAQQNEIIADTNTRRRRRKLCGTVISIALVIGLVIGLVYYFVIQGGGVPTFDLTPEDFAKEDPFNELDPGEANSWKNNGNGVSLQVINALETKWYQYFYDAVDDWDSGYPDCLTLGTEFNGDAGATSHDPSCSTVNGKVKVCNGNYGNTRWKGINEVLIDSNGNIIASAARMNEFYLGNNNDDEMQYTMCHEIGHSFGLGHTDETFGNKNLGDCMDYTNEPHENRKPTIRNFSFLFELYGLVPGALAYTPPTPAPVTPPPTDAPATVVSQNSPANTDGDGGDDRRRKLQHQQRPPPSPALRRTAPQASPSSTGRAVATPSRTSSPQEPLPDWLTRAVTEVLDHEEGRRLQPHLWRVLHSHELGAAHETDLPQGYSLRVHYLYANP